MFAPIYECSQCGDVWQIEIVEHIDCDRDEVYRIPTCRCGRTVREKVVIEDGKRVPVMHALTDEEIELEMWESEEHDW